MNIRKKLLGDKAFYAKVLAVTVPIMIQNGITNFVGLLDNIMVGRIGTEQMSGIAIVNQLLMVFNLAIFGAISGVGIFGAQFFGCQNHKGVQHTLRFKIYVGLGILVLGTIILMAGGEQLIQMYLHGEGNEQALQATLGYGREYLWVMLIGLPPFVLEEIYASTLREGGETKVPMIAGVVGAAIATAISRYVQMVVVIAWTHRNPEKMPFITGAYREWKVPGQLTWNIFRKGTPLMLNEILWSAGMAIMTQCYSTRGLDAVAALNISTVISNLFNVVFVAMGSAVSIIVGQLLGAGKMEEAKDTDRKLIAFAVMSCVVMGAIVFVLAPLFPKLYNTSTEVKELATVLLRVAALCMPIFGFLHTTYFTLRSGGKTIITFLFDSVFLWCVSIPVAYVLSRHSAMAIAALYLCCQMLDLIKCVIGFVLVKKGVWLNNIVA